MLPVQVDYWKLEETKRANRVAEQQRERELGIKGYEAESGRMTSTANLQNAQSNARNAASNERNAASNEANAYSNRLTAYANMSQAESASRNADTNARNAEINAKNAATNAYNAQINAQNAKSNWLKAEADWSQARTAADYNTWRTEGAGYELELRKQADVEEQTRIKQDQANVALINAGGAVDRGQAAKQQAELAEAYEPYREAETQSQTELNEAKKWNTYVDTVDKGANLAKKVVDVAFTLWNMGGAVKGPGIQYVLPWKK